MANSIFIEGACWVVNENNTQIIYGPKGEEWGHVIWNRVTDKVDELPRATVNMIVNLATSKEEMLKKVKEWEEQASESVSKGWAALVGDPTTISG